MYRTTLRRLSVLLLATVLGAVVTLVVTSPPANAVASGYLLTKGTGSIYSRSPIVGQGMVGGSTPRTFSYKIVNTGPQPQQFKVTVTPNSGAVTPTLLLGSAVLRSPYYTNYVAPGGSLVLTLKVKVAQGVPPGEHRADVVLRDPDSNVVLDSAIAEVIPTWHSGTGHDLAVKTGTQPFVGRWVGSQYETASAIRVGSTATFTLRLENGGSGQHGIRLQGGLSGCPLNFTFTIKEGTKDVTDAVLFGSYNTRFLASNQFQDLRLSIKLVSATTCEQTSFNLTAYGWDGQVSQSAHVIVGV